jgi:hypothetical protein
MIKAAIFGNEQSLSKTREFPSLFNKLNKVIQKVIKSMKLKVIKYMKWNPKHHCLLCVLFALSAAPVLGAIMPSGLLPGGVIWASNQVGVVGGVPNVTTIYAHLYPTNSSADINTALNHCPSNQVVYLNAGIYLITNGLTWDNQATANDGVVLRGAGPGNTILLLTNTQPILAAVRSSFADTPLSNSAMNWLSGYAQGSTNIVIGSATNRLSSGLTVAAGDLIGLCQENDPNLVNPTGNSSTQTAGLLLDQYGKYCNQLQFVTVTSVSNQTNLTIWPGVYMTNYQASLYPQVYWLGLHRAVRMTGIENLTINQGGMTYHDIPAILFLNAYNCWVKNVEFTNSWYAAVEFGCSAHCAVQDCYIHDCSGGGASSTYGVNPHASSDILIQNNIFYKITAPILVDSGASGCVFGYNFCSNMIYGVSPGWVATTISFHGAHPTMNLSEGNVGTQIDYDDIHGSSSHNTAFRNFFSGYDTNLNNATNFYLNNTYPVVINSTNRWMTFIGNVIGTGGYHTNYQFDVISCPTNYLNLKTIYQLGFFENYSPGGDPMTVTSLWCDGNYDYATHSTIWDTNGVQTLPASLYLTAQPSWWSNSVPFPPIGPDVTGLVSPFPAQLRYLAIINTPQPPTNLRD